MATFVAIQYDTQEKAEEVRSKLIGLQREYLIDLADAVIAIKDDQGRVRLNQPVNLLAAGAVGGGFWGSLIGLLFLNPLLGAAIGASAGAISGALTDIGVDDKFMKELADGMQPGTSVLFLLVRKATPDKVLPEIQQYGGKILQTSLSHEYETKLQDALRQAQETAAS